MLKNWKKESNSKKLKAGLPAFNFSRDSVLLILILTL